MATLVGSTPDLIVDNGTGCLVGDNTPSTVAASVIRALDDPNLCAVAEAAPVMVQCEFSFDLVMARYRELLGGARGTGVSAGVG